MLVGEVDIIVDIVKNCINEVLLCYGINIDYNLDFSLNYQLVNIYLASCYILTNMEKYKIIKNIENKIERSLLEYGIKCCCSFRDYSLREFLR